MKRIISFMLSVLMISNLCVNTPVFAAEEPEEAILLFGEEEENQLIELTLNPEADGYIQGGSRAKDNFGLTKLLRMRDDNYVYTYMRFNLSKITGAAEKATLRFYSAIKSDIAFPFEICVADNDSWIEGNKDGTAAENGELFSGNAPGVVKDKYLRYDFVPEKKYFEFDVTELVKDKLSDGVITLVLRSYKTVNNSFNININSRESADNKPELVIASRYTPVPDSISLDGENVIYLTPGETGEYSYSAVVCDQMGREMDETLVWKVYEAGSEKEVSGITIDNGVLKIDRLTKTCDVDIIASAASDSLVYDKLTVSLIKVTAFAEKELVILPEADTQLQGGSKSGTNFGASKTIQIRNDGYRKGLFRFDLSGVYGIAEEATLRLYKSAVTNETCEAVLGLSVSDDWTEGNKSDAPAEGSEICDKNAPGYIETIPVTIPSNTGYLDFDVKEFVDKRLENKKISIYILGTTTGGNINVSFASKESGKNEPQLKLRMKYSPDVKSMEIDGPDEVIVPYVGVATEEYKVIYKDWYGEAVSGYEPIWSIKEEASGVEIDKDGVMKISQYAMSGTVTVAAESDNLKKEMSVKLKTAEEAVIAASDAIDIGDTSYVTENMKLPTVGAYNSEIVWKSSDEGIISEKGKVNRPETEEDYVEVTLTATVSNSGATKEREFVVRVAKKECIIELEPEMRGFVHIGGKQRERLVNPYQMQITAGGTRKTLLKFDIDRIRDYKDKIEKAEIMLVPWFAQANANKIELINTAVISDDWDVFATADDGKLEIDGINWQNHIKTLKSGVAPGKFTVYKDSRYVAMDVTEELFNKYDNFPAQELTTVNKGNYTGNKLSVMLYADSDEFLSTHQYYYPIMRVKLAYNGTPSDIKIEQDLYYDEKVRIPSEGVEIRQYVATAVDEIGKTFDDVDDFTYSTDKEYKGVTLTADGRLSVDTSAEAGEINIICSSEKAGISKSYAVELMAPIGVIKRPNLLFDKESVAQLRQKVNSDTALLNAYKEMRAASAGVNPDDIRSVEQIRDEEAPWVNAISYSFTAPIDAVRLEIGFKAWGTGNWEFDDTSVMWVGKANLEYNNPSFEDGAGVNPNGWRREVISGNPELRWDDENSLGNVPVRSGKRAIGLTGYDSEDSGAWVSDPMACTGGEKYIFYAAYNQKDFSPDGAAVMFMRFLDKDGNYLDEYYAESGELNYRTISRRNGLPYSQLTAVYAMEGGDNIAYALKQYLMYVLYEMKWRIEHADDSTQLVQLGRMMQGVALSYDLLKGYDILSDEEDRQMKSYLYWLTEKLMDQTFYRHDNHHDRSHNFNADRVAGLLSVAACFPEWSTSEGYIEHALGEIEYIFGGGGLSFGNKGEWLECLRYQDAVANQLFGAFEILNRMRGINMFENENIKKFCKYPALVQTPKDAANQTYPNYAGSPQIGNSLFNEGSSVLGRAASVYKDIDPELSAELAYAWKRAGAPINAYHYIVMLTAYDTKLEEKKLVLDSEYFESNGYITFRENYGIDGKENYFVLVGKDTGYGSHQDPDRGSFSMWANSTCIAQDPGVGAYDGNSAWFRDSGAHNMVTFYESDTSKNTINGVDTKVEDVYLSENFDYARINGDDTKNTYDYTRHVAYVKNGFSAYVIWDNIENSSRRGRFNLHTISTSTDKSGNKLTSNCYNNMVLDTVVLNATELDSEIEWGRMTGGYPKVLTDFSNEPIEVAEHIKITNPRNKDFVTLLYPRKNSEKALTTETLSEDENGLGVYKISQDENSWFIVIVNNSDAEKTFENAGNLRDMRTGAVSGESLTVGAMEMKVLLPDTVSEIKPVSVQIDAKNSADVPANGMTKVYMIANVFDNYGNTMPKRDVEWSVSGNTKGVSVDENGILTVTNEAVAGGVVGVTAKVKGEEISDSTNISLVDNTGLAAVKISGAKTIKPSTTQQYNALFVDKYGRELSGYRAVWSLQSPIDGVTVSAGGELSVSSNVLYGTQIELVASYIADMTVNARFVITVGDAQLDKAEILGTAYIPVPGEAKYSVQCKNTNGGNYDISGMTVEFSLKTAIEGVEISKDGVLTVSEGTAYDTEVVIVANVGGLVEAERTVFVKEFVPASVKIDGERYVTIPKNSILEVPYTAVVYDQKGNPMSEKAVITMLPADGVDFKDNILSVTRHAPESEITLMAVYENLKSEFKVLLEADKKSDGGSSSSGGGGGGSSGGVSTGGYVNSFDVPSQKNAGFVDMQGYEWAKEAVEELKEKKIVSGINATHFNPGADITRAEFVTMLVNALNITSEEETQAFSDVKESDWYYNYVKVARSMGITEGNEMNCFEPDKNITRQEMAAMVYRALSKLGRLREFDGDNDAFLDDGDISLWAKEAVGYMKAAGIISGMGDNMFKPLDNAQRAQAAVIIHRLAGDVK